MLDTVSDVLVVVGTAIGLLLVVAAGAAAVGVGDTSVGQWLVATGWELSGPLSDLVDGYVTMDDPNHRQAAVLVGAAAIWAGVGWGLARLLRPG